jgi:tetratricopeptide (TPR) repeat protein
LENAELNFKKVVSKIKFSDFRDPEDYVMLVDTLVQSGDSKQAKSVVRDLEKIMPHQIKMPVCKAISTAYIYKKSKDPRLSDELTTAVNGNRQNIGLSSRMKLGLAKSCLENNMDAEASELVLNVMRNAVNNTEIERAAAIFEHAGRGEQAKALVQQSRQEVMDLVAAGVQKAKDGDYLGAVELMSSAVKQLPDNPQVVLNTALAYLKCLEHHGWDQPLADKARRLIDSARLLEPSNARINAMRALYDELQLKYGINRSLILP